MTLDRFQAFARFVGSRFGHQCVVSVLKIIVALINRAFRFHGNYLACQKEECEMVLICHALKVAGETADDSDRDGRDPQNKIAKTPMKGR
jgi:hypothetical protein